MASWKIKPDPGLKIEYIPFCEASKFFAVDDSGSTAGAILRKERAFVDALRERHTSDQDSIALWGTNCDDPRSNFDTVNWSSTHCATCPDQILLNKPALAAIQKSEVWFLVTDGEIYDRSVHKLAELAYENDVLSVPIVFVIVGTRGRSPDTTNISVGISFFAGAQDTLILFKETQTGKMYVIAGKGCFAPLGGSAAAQDLISWANIPAYDSEAAFLKHCAALDIQVPKIESRANYPKGTSLGSEWESVHGGPVWVDLELLIQRGLEDEDLFNLFSEEAFNNLAVAYKTRRRIPEFRTFVQAQKMEQFSPKLEDVSGAASIISRMNEPVISDEERKQLQEQLREAHAKNREHYQTLIAEFVNSEKGQNIRKRNVLVDAALRHLAAIDASGFNADLLSRRSNRARRAEQVSSDANIEIAKLDLDGPAYRGFCLVCCGEDEVMSICLKELEPEHMDNNTTDFALNFPLAAGSTSKNINIVSSQNICFQCALLGPSGLSIYKEKLKAIIPAVQYDGMNKKYINDQLYLALTTGLATGAAGIAQLFMAIVHGVMETKAWAGSDLVNLGSQMSASDHQEALQRRQTFEWMLDQMLTNTRTRKNFKETGDWVQYPEALAWAVKDFEENNMTSFAVTYPVVGFSKLLTFIQKMANGSDELVGQMRVAKKVYSVTAKYLADLYQASQDRSTGNSWKQKYLELIYQEFNVDLVPRDLHGSQSIVTSADVFLGRLSACIEPSQGEKDWRWVSTEDGASIMRKVQLILFWLLHQQKGHCTAQTFFTKIEHHEHLASAVLKSKLSVPESELHRILLSIFTKRESSDLIDPEAAQIHTCVIPFKNPFSASVLCCGVSACGEPFYSGEPSKAVSNIDAIRKARTQHFIRVFGIQNRFEKSNGHPEPTASGKSPSSIHANVHISVVRQWAEIPRDKKREILNDEEEREGFVTSVRKRLCEDGRGDIFSHSLQRDIRDVLPSFFSVLGQALRREGQSDEDITLYEHDFEQGKMEAKILWELRASGELV
jgi:hypothetical protein